MTATMSSAKVSGSAWPQLLTELCARRGIEILS
jgi:hypothetical protein